MPEAPYKVSESTYLVGSGKGGVGKSTVTVNLAVALAAEGLNVGILDADVYGPSIPVMLGLRRMSPRVEKDAEGKEVITPFYKFGVHILSIGFFVEEARSLVWRGPMLHSTLERMIRDVNWGNLDILLIDLPPGTGDVPLSLSQLLPVDGAIVVTTPQQVAMLDAIKAINTYDTLGIPLFGVVENMAGFTDPASGTTHNIFGAGCGEELATRFHAELLASIPFFPSIMQSSDEGVPPAFHRGENDIGQYYRELAVRILSKQYQPI